MKHRKTSKRELQPKMKDEIGETISRKKAKQEKVKYNHKNHWLDEDDDDYIAPNYKDEEE